MVAVYAGLALSLGFAPQSIPVPKITASFDVASATDADEAAKKKLTELSKVYEEVAKKNYVLIIQALRMEKDPVAKDVRIEVTYGYNGVAATTRSGFGGANTGAVIRVSAKYALSHPDDLGMIVHEMTHVVQSYPTYDPVWLVEGIADWVRWFHYDPITKRPHPTRDKANARASYQTTGAFLYWATLHYNFNLVPELNRAFKNRAYKESLFKDLTGKTLDELDQEWRSSL